MGINGAAKAGDDFIVLDNEKEAKNLSESRAQENKDNKNPLAFATQESAFTNNLSKELKDLSKAIEKGNVNQTYSFDDDYLEEIVETYQQIVEKIDNNPIQNDIKEIKEELANLSSTGGSPSSLPDPSNNISVPTGSQNLDNSGISELKYYIVELMKDQNEIRQIVKDLRDILEEKSDD